MKKKVTILFRVDSGKQIGLGHLQRCSALATAFRALGADVKFLQRAHIGRRPPPPQFESYTLHPGGAKSWLGVSSQVDLAQTNRLIEKHQWNVNLCVVDHYALDSNWEEGVMADKVLAIDDRPNRFHACDFFLDQNLSAKSASYRKRMLKGAARLYLGPKYTLLAAQYRKLRPAKPPRLKSPPSSLLVCFGGTDVTRETIKVCHALRAVGYDGRATFVLSRRDPNFRKLEKIAAQWKKFKVLDTQPSLSSLMHKCDLYIGASGSSTLERAALGLPAVFITSAENQIEIARAVRTKNLGIYVGDGRTTTVEDWKATFRRCLTKVNKLNQIAAKSFSTVPADGARFLASTIIQEIEKL